MKIAHNFKIKVFIKENEDYNEIEKAFLSLLPENAIEDLAKGKIKVDKEVMSGLEKITILSVYLKNNRYCTAFMKKLVENLDCENLKGEICERVDDFSRCYIRLSKKDLLEGKYVLTDSGNCFHIKMTIAAYPRRKDIADEMLCSFIDESKN